MTDDTISREAALDALEAVTGFGPNHPAIHAIRALPATPAVRVKPLVWVVDGDYVTSDHAFGFYEVVEVDGHILSRDGVDVGMFSTLEAAKAAAQADYEARILAALDTPTDPVADPRVLCDDILAELQRARAKFPGRNVTFAALVEEVGELATATFEESAMRVKPTFCFDRYINGVLMAEGVCVEREATLSAAIVVASRIASKGPNGEQPVLVYKADASAALDTPPLTPTPVDDKIGADAVAKAALHRSFPDAGDGRPMPPMGDELMIAGLGEKDARFAAVQLARHGLTLRNWRDTAINALELAHRDYMIGKGRDPEKYTSQYSMAVAALRALGGEA